MGVLPGRRPRSGRKRKPFQPAIGTDFGNVEEVEAKTRGFLARFVASAVGVAVAVTGVYGLVTGRFGAVTVVWRGYGSLGHRRTDCRRIGRLLLWTAGE